VPTCAACGQENPDGARFCLACGTALETGPVTQREERRIVTVLFVDLVGSTSRAESLDPEDVHALLDQYHRCVRSQIERFGGVVEKFVGDAVMAVFGAPVAFGDDPERGVRAALAVREAIADLNASDEELQLQTRIAVNTGEALVSLDARPGLGEAMVAGDVVNTAARLQSSAPVDGIIVGESTYLSTRGAIEYQPGEPITARGKADPVPVWHALAASTPAGERALSSAPMLGRERELGVLRSVWDRVVDEQRAHLVTIFGPPGIGKSRLAYEFGEGVAATGGLVLRGRSAPYGVSTPYAAFSAHLKQVARIFDSDTAEDATRKLDHTVAALVGDDATEVASHLASFIGLRTGAVAGDRETLFLAARRVVEQLADQRPTLLVFEDLHWADESTLDLLDELAARLHTARVFLLAVARPDLLTERPTWGGGLPAYTALPLEPLRGAASEELAARLLGGDDAADVSRLIELSEGNPLFIEEMAAALAERPAGGNGNGLPTSISAIIAARLDALPPAERGLLLDASVVGRVFWDGAVATMEEGRDVRSLLGSLERRDLVRRESVSRIQGQQQFRFKHALIRDVAYERLTRGARRTRHEAVARFLEDAEVGAVAADALAQHWRDANEPERAVGYLAAAADDAGRGWAKQRSVDLYREAIALVPDGDPRRRELQLKLAVALQAVYHLHDVEGRRGAG
jgi:class 3 adenylate cyclase